MDRKGEATKQLSDPSGCVECDGKLVEGRLDELREWAKCIEQDSQAETLEYLGESVAKQSGE